MIFIRNGPRFLFVRTATRDDIERHTVERFGGVHYTFNDALARAQENTTILFFTRPGITQTRVADAESVMLVPAASSVFLASLFNHALTDKVDGVHLGPGMILLRVVGDGDPTLEELERRYGGVRADFEEAIEAGEADDTFVSLSDQPINRVLDTTELLTPQILIHRPAHELFSELRNQGLHFITQSLERKEWYELRINIYDSSAKYDEHYERLVLVLSDLNIGMILGESWTRDHALSLFSVLAYQVRLFTLTEPTAVKRILMGLEADERGKRFVDLDLYYRNRKIGKLDKGVRTPKTEGRVELRRELLGRLTPDAVRGLREIEARLGEN
ncbi:MAG: hypothetical protein ACLFPO_09265 [Spirochaetaceae bacterium]